MSPYVSDVDFSSPRRGAFLSQLSVLLMVSFTWKSSLVSIRLMNLKRGTRSASISVEFPTVSAEKKRILHYVSPLALFHCA
jgi:hypothetical protein